MSVSRHPIALSIERQVGKSTRLLATVMALPLIDGIFPALVLAGALTYPFGIIETGLLVFGGSATVAVILAEMDGSPREIVPSILVLGLVLIPVAAMEAALAPTIESMLDMPTFQRFAGLVIVAVAAKTASARVGEYLPRPAVIIGLGLVASFQPGGLDVAVSTDPVLIAKAAATAGVGVAFALAVALAGPQLRGAVDIDRFRFGSSVALGMLALSVLQLMPTEAPVALGVLVVTAVFSFDPDGSSTGSEDDSADDDDPVVAASDDDPAPEPAAPASDSGVPTVADGGDDADGDAYRYPRSEDSRLPWL
ncbi:hypothetical protein C2R22_08105 [Salinigranum rubrum]|uniref:Uncharacterized protein n=1 Tax=Salinigranum rubrum TaxID=755307 RepID=A0A2I8VI69_9EURY|nr:DUF5794 domain-containing protein [Salinigranum rubrum]AUV81621.1 hypothetical protein C2R22_08105 [Salinigranum rubrum]